MKLRSHTRNLSNLALEVRSPRYRSRGREFPRETQTLDDHVQREEDVVSTFRLLRLCIHGFKVGAGAKGCCIGQAMGKVMDPA